MPRRLVTARNAAILLWIAGLVTYSVVIGMPTKRSNVLVWITLAVLAIGVDRPRATLVSFVTRWLPLFGALAAYDLLRGASDGTEAAAHTWPQLDVDVWLGGGRTLTERLQGWGWTPGHPHAWDYAAWAVYQSHFLMPLLIAVALWAMRDRMMTRYAVGIALLSWMALATYWLYPAQPPWMVARDGLTGGGIDRIVHQLWDDLGVHRAARVFDTSSHSSRYANTVAALPSLHAAFPMLTAVLFWGRRRWLNVLLVAYPLAMGLSLVYAGEHFSFDIVLGWAYAAIVATTVRAWGLAGQKSLTAPMLSPLPEPQVVGGAGRELTSVGDSGSRNR